MRKNGTQAFKTPCTQALGQGQNKWTKGHQHKEIEASQRIERSQALLGYGSCHLLIFL